MADYYPLIARAVAGLPQNTDEARRALYDRARNALVAQLRGRTPTLNESGIIHERRALEDAIRKVEKEVSGQSQSEQPRAASAVIMNQNPESTKHKPITHAQPSAARNIEVGGSIGGKNSITQLLFSAQGRLNRKPFWLIYLPLQVVWSIIGVVIKYNPASLDNSSIWWLFIAFPILLFGWVNLAIAIKRLHDRDLSGWTLYAFSVPLIGQIGFIIVAALPGNAGENRFGPDPLRRRSDAIPTFIDPQRFMAFTYWAAPALGGIAALLVGIGLVLVFAVPPDYLQGYLVHILFVHVPAAITCELAYAALGVAGFVGLVFRSALAESAARAAAPLAAGFIFLSIATGMLWWRPLWGTWGLWWEDYSLKAVLTLFVFSLCYIALRAAIKNEKAAAVVCPAVALWGLLALPFTPIGQLLFTPIFRQPHITGKIPPEYLWPLVIMSLAYVTAFWALWLMGIRTEVWRRRALALPVRQEA